MDEYLLDEEANFIEDFDQRDNPDDYKKKAENLIGVDNFVKIYDYYTRLVADFQELSDEHSEQLNNFIRETASGKGRDVYVKVTN